MKTTGAIRVWLARLLAILFGALGLTFVAGGVWLLRLGGSPYYLLGGGALLISAALIWRGDRRGAWLYGLFLLGTILWSLAEVGLDAWSLAPRLALFVGIGLWMLTPWGPRGSSLGRAGWAVVALVSAGAAALIGWSVHQNNDHVASVAAPAPERAADWPHYGNGPGGDRFAALRQINRGNVAGLHLAWEHHSGDAGLYDGFVPDSFETTPIKIGNRLFACSARAAFAVDATTGKRLWRFVPGIKTEPVKLKLCRGVAYHRDATLNGPCAERVLWATVDARMFAIDAVTGRVCPAFGKGGQIDLRDGMGEVKPGYYYVTSPPIVVDGKAVVGGFVDDNAELSVPSGVIRAFDVRTGGLSWAWDMGAPTRTGLPEPGSHYTRGTPNNWTMFSADPGLGLVYVPLGNPSPDFWGGLRRPFDEAYGSSLVALDIATGRPRWHFQAAHHDIWDYDLPAPPSLVDLPVAGKLVSALVQSTKQGELFVLDRRTGRPIYPVQERPVPQDAVAGERPSATQPFSVGMPTLRLPALTEADMWGITPIDQLMCRIRFRAARYKGVFTPLGMRETLTFPGSMGVSEWGGVSIDPVRKILVVNVSAVPYMSRLISRRDAPAWLATPPVHGVKPKPGAAPIDYWYNAQVGTPFALHTNPFMGLLDAPCSRPPWGRLVAIDLVGRHILWQRPIGTTRDIGPKGIATGVPLPIGTPNTAGSLVTAGGLVFFSGTLDNYLRAYDIATGRELWRARLSAGGQATPMSYVGTDGRQYVVVAAGGHIGLRTRPGDSIMAFALPRRIQSLSEASPTTLRP